MPSRNQPGPIASMALALLILLAACPAARATDPQDAEGGTSAVPTDLLAFSNGGLIESVSSTYGAAWQGLWLLDEERGTGWANAAGAKPPFEIVISVPERSKFTRFVFDTAQTENPERSAKDIDILVSDESATGGFTSAGHVTLKPAADGQGFDLPAPATGRFVKLVVTSNHGDDTYWEMMNVHGFGVALTTTPAAAVSGTYESEDYGKFHLQQTGAQLAGCYEYHHGLVQGGLEGHLMRLTWTDHEGTKTGPAVMVETRNGKGYQGLWRLGADDSWHDNWKLKKISSKIGSCPNWKPTDAKGKGGKNLIADALDKTGRIRLYGINFDSDSDRLRPDATPTLTQLAAALKAHDGWHVTVEGHTDSTSTPAHNTDLSRRRAASVKAYLAKAGIKEDRVATEGFGQDKPVASNETSLGRAQNRRVEVVRQ